MKQFSFGNQVIEIDVAGEIFQVDTNDKGLMKKLSDIRKQAPEMATDINKSIEGEGELISAYDEANNFFVKAIDAILGDGATAKIFKDRKLNPYDLLDVLGFISESISEEVQSRASRQYVNRAQRRSK